MIASLVLAAPAAAAEPWSEPAAIAGSEGADVLVDGTGVLSPLVGFYPGGTGAIVARTRDRAGRFHQLVAAGLQRDGAREARPFGSSFIGGWRSTFDVALSGRDGVAAVRVVSPRRLAVALGRPGRGYGRARVFRTARARRAKIQANDRGDVAVAFFDGRALFLAHRRGGRRFGSPVRLGPADAPTSTPAVALNRRGDTLVVWEARYGRPRQGRGHRHGLYARIRRADGRLEPLRRLGESGLFLSIRVALAESRRALVGWADLWTASVAHARPGRRFGAAQLLEERRDTLYEGSNLEIQVALRPGGPGLVAWSGVTGHNRRPRTPSAVRVSSVESDGGVVATETLSPPGVPSELTDLVVGRRGEALVLWTAGAGMPERYLAASARSADASAFGAPEAIGAPGDWAVGAVNPVTRMPVAVWVGTNGTLRYATRSPIAPSSK